MTDKMYIWTIVVVFAIGYVLGYRIGTFNERHWPTPPPAEKAIERCSIPLPPTWDMR